MGKLTFIGSGCWQGIPAPFCDDKISEQVTWDSKDFRFRTSLHVKTDKGGSILVEITPDIRLQSWKFKLKKPDICLISHWHWDHLFGLLDLDWYVEKNGLKIYGNKTTKEWYESSMSHIKADFTELNSFSSFDLDNITITPIPVDHVKDTHGFIFENKKTHKKVVYLSDLHGIPQETHMLIQNADVLIADATYLEANIYDDNTHFQKDDLIPFLEKLQAKETILTNIGSYQGLTHTDWVKKFPQYIIAYDGLEIEF